MKKLFAILAVSMMAAPANAFIVVPDEVKDSSLRTTQLDHVLCYETDNSGEMKPETYNRRCSEDARKRNTVLAWKNVEKCDDFEGCLKVDVHIKDSRWGSFNFDNRVVGTTPIFAHNNPSPQDKFDRITMDCQDVHNKVEIQVKNWEYSFDNPTHYLYDTQEAQRDICNAGFGKPEVEPLDALHAVSCGLAHGDDYEKREACKENHQRRRERQHWK